MPFIGLTLYLGSCNKDKKRSKEALLDEKREWAKDYALCSCLSLVSKTDTVFKNDISRGIYAEISDYNRVVIPNIYTDIDSLARKAFNSISPTQIPDYGGSKPYMQSCIEFSKGQELDSLIRTHDSELRFNLMDSDN